MAQARRQATTSGGPAGWVVLLGLMVLALVIAAINKGCSEDTSTPASQSPTPTGTSTGSTGGAQALDIINQINDTIRATPVRFVTGKSELDPASRTVLDKVVTVLQANAGIKAQVRGFTDDEGDADKNRELSEARAQAVVEYLVNKGIAAGRLSAIGLGEANAAFPNDTDANRAKNRRVEFALA